MGNRANVVFVSGYNRDNYPDHPRMWEVERVSPTIYLHWNGGPESVYAFLAELDARNIRADGDYEAARFVQLIGEFFDDDYRSGLSLGIVNTPPTKRINEYALDGIPTDTSDNGFYVVSRRAADITHRVRRFTSSCYVPEGYVEDAGGYSTTSPHRYILTEWPKEDVDEEYRKVLNHATYNGIGEFFDSIRGFTTYNEWKTAQELAG